MFPRIYDAMTCPLDGYAGYSFRVLVNPTGAEKDDFQYGNLGDPSCPDCQPGQRCDRCQTARTRWARVFVAIYGTSHAEGLDFSTPEQALLTMEQPDIPDELLGWLYMLPPALWGARNEEVKKKLGRLSTTGDSTFS